MRQPEIMNGQMVETPRRGERRWIRRLAAFVDRRSGGAPSARWSYKLYVNALSRSMRHMGTAGPRFSVSDPHPITGMRQLYWEGRHVGTTRPPAELEDTRRGHCFIVATGPSLNQINLKLLHGHPTFGVNGAIAKFKEAGLSPTYYAISDDDFFENRFPMVRDVIASRSKCFFSFAGLSRVSEFDASLLDKTDYYLMEVINRRYGHPRLPLNEFRKWAVEQNMVIPEKPRRDDCRVGFSRDFGKGIFCSRTILYMALQIAYHIGYRKLFILGMDMDYHGASPRFYESSAQMRPSKIARDFEPHILPSFELLRGICDREGLQVFNLSPTSQLPESVIPRLTLEQALAMTAAGK